MCENCPEKKKRFTIPFWFDDGLAPPDQGEYDPYPTSILLIWIAVLVVLFLILY